MLTFIKNLITESDNKTYDVIRILALFAIIEFMVKSWIGTFDPISFGQGFGYIVAGAGIALGLKPETKAQDVSNSN